LPFGKGEDAAHRGNAEGLGDLAVLVGDEREGKFVVGLEFLLCVGRVAAHAEDLQVFRLEGFEGVAQRAGLRGASRRVGFRVEKNQRRPLGVDFREIERLPVLIGGGDAWGLGADFQGFDFAGK